MCVKVERLSAEADAALLRNEYRDAPRFLKLCKECPGFSSSWLCPPVAPEILKRLDALERVRVEALKIVPEPECSLTGAEIIQQHRIGFEHTLLELEKELGGIACGFSGRCPYCGNRACSRPEGLPCRHPEKARQSLEALGFDVAGIAADVLATPIKWEVDGCRPPYYMLVGAVFY